MNFIISNLKELNYLDLISINGGFSYCSGSYKNQNVGASYSAVAIDYTQQPVFSGTSRSCSGNNLHANYYSGPIIDFLYINSTGNLEHKY